MAGVGISLTLLLERLYIAGPAQFYWQAIANGWISTVAYAWICYLMRPPAADTDRDGLYTQCTLLTAQVSDLTRQLAAVMRAYLPLPRPKCSAMPTASAPR